MIQHTPVVSAGTVQLAGTVMGWVVTPDSPAWVIVSPSNHCPQAGEPMHFLHLLTSQALEMGAELTLSMGRM